MSEEIRMVSEEERDVEEYYESINQDQEEVNIEGWEWEAGDLLQIMYRHNEVNRKSVDNKAKIWFADNPRFECPACNEWHEDEDEARECCEDDSEEA